MNKIFTLLLCASMMTFRLQAHDFILADSAASSKTSFNTLSSDIIAAQEQQIRTAVLFALVPVIVAFSFIVFIFHRAKREAFFKQKKAELEVKALRAQINPHFIFNCLNSIHHYMHRHSAQLSGDYLLKFSQLMRYVLETSSSRMVPLADDIEILKIYIELEQMRMQGCFEFQIITSLPDASAVNIPPMMMQPFVENSIWHGLSNKGPGGSIRVIIDRKDDMLSCLIEDNGTTTPAPKENEHSMIKKTSMGMSLIRDRLAVVSQIYKVKAGFTISSRQHDPIPQQGTRILLFLPLEE